MCTVNYYTMDIISQIMSTYQNTVEKFRTWIVYFVPKIICVVLQARNRVSSSWRNRGLEKD